MDLSNPDDIKESEQVAEALRRQEMNDLRTVLSNSSGLRFVWRLLQHCNTFNSIYDSDSNLMSFRSGQQDIGHFLMSEIVAADENLLLKLMKNKDNKGVRNGS